ncbi:MAG: polynucleotide kinase-phosphatase [Chloroflexota bacterium]
MKLTIPELSLVVLIGASGSGKSTFARTHFRPTETISSDFCRALVSDDENSQEATEDAFAVLQFIAGKRLAGGRLTVIDATNVQAEARRPLVELARAYHCLPVAIVFDLPERLCHERNASRTERDFGPHVIARQTANLRGTLRGLGREGFRHVFTLSSVEEIAAVEIERQPLWNNRKHEHGPFDIIGDVHGCADELAELLGQLGYRPAMSATILGRESAVYTHPEGRKAVFLGDLVDRGPRTLDTVRIVWAMTDAGSALCIPGNHDVKLLRKLRGRDVRITHGLETSLAEIEALPQAERAPISRELAGFLDRLVSHYVLDDGKLVVAHAGLKETMQGRGSRAVREFCLYGETTGETDEFGLPVRHNWAAEYHGKASVVYGHTPVPTPEWFNNTINIDTGCVFGGSLTALRYPERDLVSVHSRRTYQEPARPFLPPIEEPILTVQQQHDDILDIDDVLGKRLIETRLRGKVTIREENASAALEVMGRFAADPRWLVYLPPTMSPSETTSRPDLLEHPEEAFAYYRTEGVTRVVCEEKHMGSRAVVVVCKDEDTARSRFGVVGQGAGIVYTRTGRRFFSDEDMERALLGRVRRALTASGLWDELTTDWVVLDCELMPWSAKAQDLLRQQYAAVGAASGAALPAAITSLEQARTRGAEIGAVLDHFQQRAAMAERYVEAYRRYCWSVASVDDLKLAPFHILASEGAVHSDRDHVWHMETPARICREDPALLATPFLIVDLTEDRSREQGIRWWEELTGHGGEGMVVKPYDFIPQGRKGIVQPAIKCRGHEYLRIIYGPEYTAPDNLTRLRNRNVGAKRSLAIREFALGIEALERFVRREPLRRIHECVFGVLALESEPVDPRL